MLVLFFVNIDPRGLRGNNQNMSEKKSRVETKMTLEDAERLRKQAELRKVTANFIGKAISKKCGQILNTFRTGMIHNTTVRILKSALKP